MSSLQQAAGSPKQPRKSKRTGSQDEDVQAKLREAQRAKQSSQAAAADAVAAAEQARQRADASTVKADTEARKVKSLVVAATQLDSHNEELLRVHTHAHTHTHAAPRGSHLTPPMHSHVPLRSWHKRSVGWSKQKPSWHTQLKRCLQAKTMLTRRPPTCATCMSS